MVEYEYCGVNSHFKCLFEKKIVCLSVCLPFFESADARDLGLMTLLTIKWIDKLSLDNNDDSMCHPGDFHRGIMDYIVTNKQI